MICDASSLLLVPQWHPSVIDSPIVVIVLGSSMHLQYQRHFYNRIIIHVWAWAAPTTLQPAAPASHLHPVSPPALLPLMTFPTAHLPLPPPSISVPRSPAGCRRRSDSTKIGIGDRTAFSSTKTGPTFLSMETSSERLPERDGTPCA